MFRLISKLQSSALAAVLLMAAPTAHALPALQIYSPDAVYDASNQTWVITSSTFELWVIGDVGSKGTIYNVDLVASTYGSGGTITLTPALPIDPLPELDRPGYSGLTNHDEFKNADGHTYWTIGDFTETTDTITDYQPGSTSTGFGEIKKFMVHVTGYDAVHFDAFDHYFTGGGTTQNAHYVFSPPSHDATTTTEELPEPSALLLFGTGIVGLVATRKRTL